MQSPSLSMGPGARSAGQSVLGVRRCVGMRASAEEKAYSCMADGTELTFRGLWSGFFVWGSMYSFPLDPLLTS